jgi:hypothetical protein
MDLRQQLRRYKEWALPYSHNVQIAVDPGHALVHCVKSALSPL